MFSDLRTKKIILIYFVYLSFQLLGVFFFFKGFFKLKHESRTKSDSFNHLLNQSSWFSPSFNKSILIIIDGLRYDFAYSKPSNEIETPSFYYLNQMPIFSKILKEKPEQTLFFQAYSDPPTVTTQRIKSLTSGNLPSFLEFTENFDGKEIQEDNVLYHLVKNGKKIYFMGVDIWTHLYPTSFEKAFAFDSFSAFDLDSVDNGIISALNPLLEDQNEWDFIICHFLGVDHAGHAYQANHKEMKRKLTEMNEIIQKVISKMDNSTILFVMGDHGMSEDGNHGGATNDETKTILFAHSQKNFSKFIKNHGDQIQKNPRNEDNIEIINQIDFVASFSMLSGIPIPYANLGSIILDLMIDEKEEILKEKILDYNFINFKQIETYMKEFQADFGKLNEEEYEEFIAKIAHFTERYHNYKKIQVKNLRNEDFLSFIAQTYELMNNIKDKFREIWTEFNLKLMLMGMLMMILSLLSGLYIISFVEYNIQTDSCFLSNFLFSFNDFIKITKFCFYAFLALSIFSLVYEIEFLEILAFFSLMLSANFTYFCYRNNRDLKQEIFRKDKSLKGFFTYNLIGLIIFWGLQISHGYMLFAVSHIRNEGQAILFVLMVTNLIYCLITVFSKISTSIKINNIKNIIIISILLYLASFFENTLLNRNNITLKKYFKNSLAYFPILEDILTSVFVRLFIPILIFLYLFRWLRLILEKFSFCLYFSNFLIVVLHFILKEELFFSKTEHYPLVNIYLPRTSFVITFICTINNILAKNEKTFRLTKDIKFFLFIFPFCISSLMIFGKNGIFLVVVLFFVIKQYISTVKVLGLFEHMQTVTYLASISYFFWYAFGNKPQIAALQVSNVYLGLEKFNFYISGLFLVINCGASFILCMLSLPLFSFKKKAEDLNQNESRSLLEKEGIKLNYIRVVLVFGLYFMTSVACTSGNCIVQRRALLLIEDFAPKFFFDSCIFIFVNLLLIIFLLGFGL